MKEKLLISACLLGHNVKYNGGNNQIDIEQLKETYELVPFCPEVEGGLSTPRPASEIISNSPLIIKNIKGENVSEAFILGAKKAVALIKKEGIKKALLKANSPSCGKGKVYDGSFSGTRIEGDGITVKFLEEAGIEVFDEKSNFDYYLI